jgi:hypothetical protein
MKREQSAKQMVSDALVAVLGIFVLIHLKTSLEDLVLTVFSFVKYSIDGCHSTGTHFNGK